MTSDENSFHATSVHPAHGFARFAILLGLVLWSQGAAAQEAGAQDSGIPDLGAAVERSLDLSITDPDEIALVCGGETALGEPVFAQNCASCHTTGAGEGNRAGPALNGLFGRTAGSVEGFDYSQALRAAGAEGMIWERETLHAYLTDPQGFLPGGSKTGPAIDDTLERTNLMTWLRVNTQPPPPARGEVEVPAAVLAMAGDVAYGEYLAAECAGCHLLDGTASGNIPPITGLDRQAFLTAMYEYRLGARPNQTMQRAARSLDEEALAALAAYFAELE